MSNEQNTEHNQEEENEASLPEAANENILPAFPAGIENTASQQPVESTELIAINEQPSTENMEVHHHPHVEKKNFKEYFLEFLMIFLAVTMGFFAESLREHLVNSEKEKVYMESLIQDLKRDTAKATQVIAIQSVIFKKMDSAL